MIKSFTKLSHKISYLAIFFTILISLPFTTVAATNKIKSFKLSAAANNFVIRINQTNDNDYDFTIRDDVLEIIIKNSEFVKNFAKIIDHSIARSVKQEMQKKDAIVNVLLMKHLRVNDSYLVRNDELDNYDIIFELSDASNGSFSLNDIVSAADKISMKDDSAKNKSDYDLSEFLATIEKRDKVSKPVIVLDAGHGGKDPGARNRGVNEKDITLKYAKAIAKYLRRTGKYRVYLTRKSDYYVPLRKRNEFARKVKADLFLSIHADSARNKYAAGASVYTLSKHGSDKEADELAKKENRSDIITGIDLSDVNKEAAHTLIEMSQTNAMNYSKHYVNFLVPALKKNISLRKRPAKSAAFVVLKNSEMASVLIEIGFLSNNKDLRKIRSSRYRNKFIKSLAKSIDKYFVSIYK
jgi:N-acetylmuramoyl-L-alanine amidase